MATGKKTNKGLGKGLGALFADTSVSKRATAKAEASTIAEKNEVEISDNKKSGEAIVSIALVVPNAGQPRKEFNKELLDELTESVKQYGVLQPLIVKKKGATYEIIAGERRWRAAQAAGLKEVPVVIRDYSKQEAMEISIIENVQRADLNPIEEAKAYSMLMNDYELTQEEVAAKVSKNRATIANTLRLLKLDDEVQNMMIEGVLTSGHARALLSIEDKAKQRELAKEVVAKNLSVREIEKYIKQLKAAPKAKKKKDDDKSLDIYYNQYEDKLRSKLGTKVHINRKDKNKGRIEIDYYSTSELERIMDLIDSISGGRYE